MNIADMRTTHSRDAYAQLQEAFGDQVFETVIRASIAYAESAEKALSILEYRPDLGADYLALGDEVLALASGGSYTDRGQWRSGSSIAMTRRRSRGWSHSGSRSTPTSSTWAQAHTAPRRVGRAAGSAARTSCSWTRSAARATHRC